MKFFCHIPFETLLTTHTIQSTCCPNWPHPSRLVTESIAKLDKAWNAPQIVEFRQALLDGDDRYCHDCPFATSPARRQSPTPRDRAVMDAPPITLQIATDLTCNLACPTCRPYVMTRKIGYKLEGMVNQFPGLQVVSMLMSGDPLASKHCMEWLTSGNHNPPHVLLWTNGLLIPRLWSSIKRRVTMIVQSIDAASQATYENVRRPGKWQHLLESLEFVSRLVKTKEVMEWQWNFVVQSANFREMPAFVEMANKYGAHRVQFAAAAAWAHIKTAEWAEMNVCNSQHPLHAELLSVLEDDRLKLPFVDSGALTEEARKTVADKFAGESCFEFRI